MKQKLKVMVQLKSKLVPMEEEINEESVFLVKPRYSIKEELKEE